MPRKRNDTLDLARWFVTQVLGRSWTRADYGGSHMAHAKKVLKGYSIEDIKGCVLAVRDNPAQFGFPASFEWRYLSTVLKGEPPLIEQYLTPPDPPPVWSAEYDQWVIEYGKKAFELEIWDGIYLPINEPGRLTYEQIKRCVGVWRAKYSLEERSRRCQQEQRPITPLSVRCSLQSPNTLQS